ncbi:glycoside hydrolase family 15 protein [Mangrovihabitans endophyticus]|uniref:Glucoamylase n=1 Tax=Mangrovihabitans endophyticus TaxID=1751298 RepID=A0A8J3C2A9_9ACTN|nr:glycoside hydrolase family 15 protein [Mangrovihabitans endophyticus]GGL08373.1 glucoamylase [Mangrovihabitans endophyticus]
MTGKIEDYALIGDLQTAALVGLDGSIDWLCLPRFDSPACFAALLGDESAGRWQLAPVSGGTATRRRYRDDTLILESEWETPSGTVRVTDCMPPRGEAADVVRVVEGLRGTVRMASRLRLRFGYGRNEPWIQHRDGDMAAIAGPDAVWLHADVPVDREEFDIGEGDRVSFVLTYRESWLPRPQPVDPAAAVRDTEKFWTDWIGTCGYDGRWAEVVRRSLILLKALTYAPTGGILAAATSSLPERIGGSLNWDYRYCWLRDSTFTLQAMLGTGYVQEAQQWRQWLLRAIAGNPADLQILYALDGSRRLPEYTLDWLPGYEHSEPVRAGNAAAGQFQLDVWGEVLNTLHQCREEGGFGSDESWDFQLAMLDFLAEHWRDPGSSLWEVRGEPRHYVHSKVMAWAGFDRAVTAVERHGLPGPVAKWRRIRAEIHAEVCEKGYDAERNTFLQSYGSSELDAALLLIPRSGFLPADDPRVAGTVDAVMRELSKDGFLLRYQASEGVFVACSFWLVDALHRVGREKEAEELFERMLGLRNDVGMLSEEYDPKAGRQLGNTPQAFSLVGLVNSARLLSGAATETR